MFLGALDSVGVIFTLINLQDLLVSYSSLVKALALQ